MSADTEPEPKAVEPLPASGSWLTARWLIVAAVIFVVVAVAGAWAFNEFSDPPQIKATPRPRIDDPIEAAKHTELLLLPEVTLSKQSDRSGYLHGKAHNQSGETLHRVKLWIKTAKWDRVYEVKVAIEHGTTGPFSVYIGERRIEVEEFKVLLKWEHGAPNW